MENCGERIPVGSRSEAYSRGPATSSSSSSSSSSSCSGGVGGASGNMGSADPSPSYLPPPPFDCHSHNMDDKDYAIPSTPVRPPDNSSFLIRHGYGFLAFQLSLESLASLQPGGNRPPTPSFGLVGQQRKALVALAAARWRGGRGRHRRSRCFRRRPTAGFHAPQIKDAVRMLCGSCADAVRMRMLEVKVK